MHQNHPASAPRASRVHHRGDHEWFGNIGIEHPGNIRFVDLLQNQVRVRSADRFPLHQRYARDPATGGMVPVVAVIFSQFGKEVLMASYSEDRRLLRSKVLPRDKAVALIEVFGGRLGGLVEKNVPAREL